MAEGEELVRVDVDRQYEIDVAQAKLNDALAKVVQLSTELSYVRSEQRGRLALEGVVAGGTTLALTTFICATAGAPVLSTLAVFGGCIAAIWAYVRLPKKKSEY